MKAHTAGFKNTVKQLGRKLKGIITYDNVTLEDEIYSITPHYEGAILKSVMRQLDIEVTIDIPIGTILNCQIGILVGNDYEMLNFGNYIVYNSEKQEDKGTYKITCYDKLLYSMRQNEDMHITYPITIKNYLNRVASMIGLTVATTSFYNDNLQIQGELYLGLEYTYRDILDEIAQATGSIICLNGNDEIIVKYPTQTNDTIDEDFLKDVNVDFGQKYGEINSIVLSRSGESDNVYLRDEESVIENGLTEVKIVDNQIMNFNDRSDYLQGILHALDGLYYYINDYSSTGILYYEVGDLYNVQVDNKTYQCLMLNDEIEVTTGIKEQVYAEMPKETETDYTKADKTDRRINQTYLIVDKQNQTIESVISDVSEQNQKLVTMQQSINEIDAKISDIADVTTSDSTLTGVLEMDSINESEPVKIEIHPTGQQISHLIIGIKTIIGNNAILRSRTLRFTNLTTQEVFNYILPDNLFYYDSENYDTFTLEYEGQICQVEKKCKLQNGDIVLLNTPVITNYPYPDIHLTTGDYRIELVGYTGYIFARLMCTNIYTEQFATKVEVTSQINQKANEITAQVSETLTNYVTETQMTSAINIAKNEINLNVSEVNTKATTAQSTANNAVNLANNAQASATNAQTTADNAQDALDDLSENLTTNYYTKSETSSAINQKANEITSSVSQTYSTKTETTQAKNDAINTANANTTQVLQSYSTTEQMNSAINQKANEITTSVNQVSSRTTTAQNTANSAVSKADNAQDTADDALSKANNAQSTADNATTKATNAQSTADSATTKANNAQSTANTATTKADNAQSTANTANTKAENAQTTANTATTKADNAQTSADNAQTSANNALQDIQDTNNAITGINENIDDINAQITDLVEQTTTFSTKSELQQTAESFEASITQTTETLTRSINGTQSEISEIKNYIHYDIQDTTGTLTLGKTDNPYTLQLTNHELKINENDNTVAYFDEDSMQVTNGVFNTSLAIGNFEFRPETNGSLSFTRRLS